MGRSKEMTDAELLALSAKGDQRAYSIFARRHGAYLLALLGRFGLDHSDAQDVAQRALLGAWRNAHRYDPQRAKARTWLSSIALNQAKTTLRGEARRRAAHLRLAQEPGQEKGSPPVQHPRSWSLAGALEQLSEEERRLIVLRVELEHSFEEIGQLLGIQCPTARQRFHRALAKLRRGMDLGS